VGIAALQHACPGPLPGSLPGASALPGAVTAADALSQQQFRLQSGRQQSVDLTLNGSEGGTTGTTPEIRRELPVKDYADLRGPSLLKKTLGLQNHRHSSLVGSTSLLTGRLGSSALFLTATDDIPIGPNATLRSVSDSESFILYGDDDTRNYDQEMDDVDAIEGLVAPHGQALVNLYFRIVHPTFPILHKRVFLEKYARTHREFSPPLLAAVYAVALDWWSYSTELSLLPKPNANQLLELAFRTMSNVIHRAKLSTIQAGLLLHQRAGGDSWAATSQLVGLAQDLGLHLDCTSWRIPSWEKGLRKRLAWALYLQDKWGSLVHGRPSHMTKDEWIVQPLRESDFPERAADEDDEEGSTEVVKGRLLFCQMIQLTIILSDILSAFYTVRAAAEIRCKANRGVTWILQRAKPLQLQLRTWYSSLPDCLRLHDVTMRKLSSTGYLHLAYYAAEITLHRRIVGCLASEENADVVGVCRNAARERLLKALDFVTTLRPEHLQSFWHSASTYNFALIGSFIALLWETSLTREEADAFKARLDDYRWRLRLESKNADILSRALALMTSAVGSLVRPRPAPPRLPDQASGSQQEVDEDEQEYEPEHEQEYGQEQEHGHEHGQEPEGEQGQDKEEHAREEVMGLGDDSDMQDPAEEGHTAIRSYEPQHGMVLPTEAAMGEQQLWFDSLGASFSPFEHNSLGAPFHASPADRVNEAMLEYSGS